MLELRTWCVVLVLGLTAERSAGAQVVRGTALLPDSSAAAGVVVVAIDERGQQGKRALTNNRGEFVLRLDSAGRYRLRVARIGYLPTVGPVVTVEADSSASVRLVLGDEPIVLSKVDVRARGTCRVNADTGLMVARVWDEARKAMLSTQLSASDAPLVAEWIEYDRTFDSTLHRLREQHIRTLRHPTTHAFRSASPETLAAKGFVATDGSAVTYYAPDAQVLLSDTFAASHCFRLERTPSEHPNQIGVAFEPTRERSEMHDIAGTFWLDEQTAELKTLRFRYLNLPDAAFFADPGGEVEFLRLPEGEWLVNRWSIRMPNLAMPQKSNEGFRRTIKLSTTPELRGMQVTGGEVTRLMRGDSVLYQLAGAQIAVQLLERDTIMRAANARLTLDGTDYAAAADASGHIEIWPVLAGRYHARIRTPLMDSLGMSPLEQDVEARADLHVDTLRLPAAPSFVQFEVVDPNGEALGDVTLEAQSPSGSTQTVVTPANGHIALREAAPGRMVLRARRIGYQPGEVTVTVAPGRNDVTVILSELTPPELDTVRVVASARVAARLQGFEERRAKKVATVSITREDILRRNPTEAWQMLANVPSLRIVENDTVVAAASPRAMLSSFKNDVCYVAIAVDGVVKNPSRPNSAVDLRELPRPEDIHGIEFFAGPSSIPVQFNSQAKGTWCGLIAIWTR
jgi:carboxypeptidase family protein